MAQQILPFHITIGPRRDDGRFPVRARAGETEAEGVLELPEALIALGERLLAPGGQAPARDLEGLGRQLGRALFTPRLRGLLIEQARAAAHSQRRLQIQMQIAVPELAALPWEWLAIGSGRPWMPALREEYTLVRVGRQARPAPPIVVEGPLRVLAAGGPDQSEQLDGLVAALAGPIRERRVVIEPLPDADLDSIAQALARRQYHVLHIAAPAMLTDDERLVVGLGRGVDGFELADALADHPTLRLAMLPGGMGDGAALTVAPALLGAVLMVDLLPAAATLSIALPPETSAQFAATVYDELAAGAPIDLAVTVARRSLTEEPTPVWGAAQLRVLPDTEALFVMRPARPQVNARRLLPIALAALLIVALLLTVRGLSTRMRPDPLDQRIPTGQSFVLPNFPAVLPTATATPPQPTPPPLPPAESYLAYTVALSDTLDQIAARFGSDTRGIVEVNGLEEQAPLRSGRTLVVPVYRAGETRSEGYVIALGDPEQPNVALTFDIEIDDSVLYQILETLRARDIHATFFVTGSWVSAYPDAARAIVRDGHELGNHSYTHPYFSRIGLDGAALELDETERIVREITGATTRPYFRFPYGDSTSDMLAVVARRGYIAYHWTTDDAGFATWIERAVANPDAGRGAILLMHGRADTAAALPGWLDQIIAAGLKPTTLGETIR